MRLVTGVLPDMKEPFENPVEANQANLPSSVTIEVGSGLSYLLKTTGSVSFITAINDLRTNFIREWGFQLPLFIVRENKALDCTAYRFLMFNRELVKRTVSPGKTLIIASEDQLPRIPGRQDSDPIYSRPCVWIEPRDSMAYTHSEPYVVSIEEVITEHLEAVLRANARDFVTTDLIRDKLKPFYNENPVTIQETLSKVSFTGFVRIIRNLVSEGIPLTRMEAIVRTLASLNLADSDPDIIAERLRNLLKDSIHDYIFRDRLMLFAVPDSRMLLWFFKYAAHRTAIPENDPVAKQLLSELTNLHLTYHTRGFRIGLICSSSVRLAVRRFLERTLPGVVVLKPEEIDRRQDLKIVKKIRTKGVRAAAFWYWFWITESHNRKRRFKEDLNSLFTFLSKHLGNKSRNAQPSSAKTQPLPQLSIDFNRLSRDPGNQPHNLPVLRTYSGIQKAAAELVGCTGYQLKSVLNSLERRESVSLLEEMGNLILEPMEIKMTDCPDARSMLLSDKQVQNLIAEIKSSISKEPDFTRFTPLQKLAVFLSSLSPGTSERLYSQILADMSRSEIESLTHANQNRQVISLQKARSKIIEDFMWYLKGNDCMTVPYSSEHWLGNLQRVSMRSPRKVAAALRDLWLTSNTLLERFDRFAYQNPNLTAFWIRRFITSKIEPCLNLHRVEKAYILLQLLPEELSENVIGRMDKTWNPLFTCVPRRPHETTPAEAGFVLRQFLSYYYSVYDQKFSSKTTVN